MAIECEHGHLARKCETCEYEAEIARLKAQLEAAQAKADVIGGEWCRQNRAEGRGACGACSLCVADANDLVQRLADTILAMYESETTASAGFRVLEKAFGLVKVNGKWERVK